jgi:hypothetical protein
VIWGWRPGTGYLVRVRLDGDTAYVATHLTSEPSRVIHRADDKTGAANDTTATLPWSLDDGRIAASRHRGPAATDGGVGAAYEQIVVEGINDAVGPITFLRPAQ